MKLIFLSFSLLIFSGLYAQGKLFLIPHLDCYVGAYHASSQDQQAQPFIKTKPFQRKEFFAGLTVSYALNEWEMHWGIKQGNFQSGYYHNEGNVIPRLDSKQTIGSLYFLSTYLGVSHSLFQANLALPKKMNAKSKEKKYLFVSTLRPRVDFCLNVMTNRFLQGYTDPAEIATYDFNINGNYRINYKHKVFPSVQTGFDWVFYNSGKPKFILSLLYKFAFKDQATFSYHFEKPSRGIDFDYTTYSRGNGFSIEAGIPIKLFTFKPKYKRLN